ncbi:MAG: tetratricopeptide repeat protein [Acidobacteriota bacterium]|nr:tetratricopeptide repeat protein [Acidobacteriota bacterium]
MTHLTTRSILVTCLFLFLNCQLSVVWTQNIDTTEDLANINFTADVRVFAVMATLNAAGFNYETPGREISQTRQLIREKIKKIDPGLLEELQTFYRNHNLKADDHDQQIAYTSLALLLSSPPDFQVTVQETELPEDVKEVLGFEKLVTRFYQEADIESLWHSQQPVYEEELASYRILTRDLIAQTLRYFRIPSRVVLDRQIILIPDLLNAKAVVNVRNLDLVYYVVVGPTDNASENYRQIQHEYLHFLIDPLIEKFGMTLIEHGDVLDIAHAQPQLKPQFRNKFFLLVAESLIESVLLRLHDPEHTDRELARLFRQGLIFAPYFSRGLKRYELDTEMIAFPAYVEVLLDNLEGTIIERDEREIVALENKIEETQQKEWEAQQKEIDKIARLNRLNSLLNEAAVLLSNREFQSAKIILQEIVLDDPYNGVAYFYLAQIASQTEQHEQALEYYKQAANAPGVATWAQAWSLVRIAKYHAIQGEIEEALTFFDRVSELEGNLRGAKEEAQKATDQLR